MTGSTTDSRFLASIDSERGKKRQRGGVSVSDEKFLKEMSGPNKGLLVFLIKKEGSGSASILTDHGSPYPDARVNEPVVDLENSDATLPGQHALKKKKKKQENKEVSM